MKVAVADVGTSSSHLLIAKTSESGYHVMDALKIRTKLGECLDSRGHLTPEGEQRLREALAKFHELATSAGAPEVRVYATSALREAPNGTAVAERVLESTDVYPAIISGEREGELTYLGVAHSLELGNNNVLLDLGGGSLEIVQGNEKRSFRQLSFPLGSIRMTRAYIPDGIGKPAQIRAVRDTVRAAISGRVEGMTELPHTRFVLSSGTARAAATAIMNLRGQTGGLNGVQINVSELADLLERVSRTKPADRRFAGLEKRLDTIVAGLTVLHETLLILGAKQFTVSEGALREGMLIEELSRYQQFKQTLSTRQRSVLQTAERFRVNVVHAQQVAELSKDLFDRLSAAGISFPEGSRSLLRAAAALHQAGLIVSQQDHHKHSAYLIRNAGLLGFSPNEIECVAQVARYHRGSLPKNSHAEWVALSPEDRDLVARLAAILRVADALDRSHSGGTNILRLQHHKTSNTWHLQLQGASALDLAALKASSELWEREFGALILEEQED